LFFVFDGVFLFGQEISFDGHEVLESICSEVSEHDVESSFEVFDVFVDDLDVVEIFFMGVLKQIVHVCEVHFGLVQVVDVDVVFV
jgi:hypothetical protein